MDHSVKPATAAALSASSSSTSRRWALATSLCTLACLFLLSAGALLLVAAGYRPLFQPRTAAAWDRFSRLQKAAAPARVSHDAAAAPAPPPGASSPGGGLDWGQEDEEDAGGSPAPAPVPAAEEEGKDGGAGGGECDVFVGEWVEEPVGYPLYDAAECPFLSDQVACRRNGRPDSGYEQWRWRPMGCGGRTRSVR
jgi:hypothetical protein